MRGELMGRGKQTDEARTKVYEKATGLKKRAPTPVKRRRTKRRPAGKSK
jgi:hypothetical protein